MIVNKWIGLAALTTIFVAGFALGSFRMSGDVAHAQGKHVYELRTYTAPEGSSGISTPASAITPSASSTSTA